ncbi:MAG: Pantothenate synthetase [Alphaproteobacteria bacterium MarineAlpha11_Bin1]|nr:MAG: Pantothenate synthetase [Alphaproteobacteria bacterium MarineAlpha11_Bin1]|tara:strand:- start:2422 stop:3279 length:858 start_codon:yes stop_codon:yes gene_type:complete
MPMQNIVRTAAELRKEVERARGKGLSVGLVPTMGALHEGHFALVRQARRDCGIVIASLFVNPTQFGENEDFDTYPRDEVQDFGLFQQNGVDIVYAPGVEEMYPEGFGITVTVAGLTEGLCGTIRPGHFEGVTTVVSKLFYHCCPDAAYFGEKDYQQLKVVEQMVRDLDLSIRVVGIPIVRERDGLALSSRNARLSVAERRIAPALPAAMRTVAGRLSAGVDLEAQCVWGRDELLRAGFDRVEYFEIRDSQTLQRVGNFRSGLRLFVAARLRETRLIDNLAVDKID